MNRVEELRLNLVQLHGKESVEYCKFLTERQITVIKAFGIDEQFDFSVIEKYSPYCQYFLFDTKTNLHGGSGIQFDWEILKKYTLNKPIFLSGGIGPQDIESIRQIVDIPIAAVDINSKFELLPALKNIGLLTDFIHELRS